MFREAPNLNEMLSATDVTVPNRKAKRRINKNLLNSQPEPPAALPPMDANMNAMIAAERNVVYRYALQLTHDPNEADELTQDVLLRGMLRQETFTPGTYLRAWLKKIALNLFLEGKRRAKHTIEPDAIPANHHLITDEPTGERNMAEQECLQFFDSLPDKLARPLRMFCQGYQYPDICKALKLPSGTVKNRIFLARKEMTKYLQRESLMTA
ncbi:MAG: RNA polymerase sigma factor [Bacteroidota bacterium]|nr:RNA polymerase sigma factor [Bacteroidota bacterium]